MAKIESFNYKSKYESKIEVTFNDEYIASECDFWK
jgi:hypothetical protein